MGSGCAGRRFLVSVYDVGQLIVQRTTLLRIARQNARIASTSTMLETRSTTSDRFKVFAAQLPSTSFRVPVGMTRRGSTQARLAKAPSRLFKTLHLRSVSQSGHFFGCLAAGIAAAGRRSGPASLPRHVATAGTKESTHATFATYAREGHPRVPPSGTCRPRLRSSGRGSDHPQPIDILPQPAIAYVPCRQDPQAFLVLALRTERNRSPEEAGDLPGTFVSWITY